MTRPVLALVLAVAPGVWVQAQAPSRDAVLAAARTVIADARYATLVTIDADGHPQARVVDPFAPEADFTIWIATNARTRKVAELRSNPRVTLLFFDPRGQSYVTLGGTAAMVTGAAEKARHWKPEWKAFYADEHRGDDYVLIKVRPDRLEIVAEALGMKSDPATWRPIAVTFP